MIDLDLLVEYHYWARDRMLDALAPLDPDAYLADRGNSFRSIRDTVVHVYSAEWAWCSRWYGTSPSAHVLADTFPDVASARAAWSELEGRVRSFLANLDEAGRSRVVEYRAFNGQAMRSVLWHMVQHVVNHASYHRGQITTMLRQSGAAGPKSTDLITFYRERG